MGFRLGEKTKKGLRIGAKVGAIAGAVALGTKGASVRETQSREGASEAFTSVASAGQQERSNIQTQAIATRHGLGGGRTDLPAPTKAISNKPAIARQVAKGTLAVARAPTPKAKVIAGLKTGVAVRSVPPSVPANVDIEKFRVGITKGLTGTPAVRPGTQKATKIYAPTKPKQPKQPRRGMTERVAGFVRGGAPAPKPTKRRR
tara:strand:- start:85 stop:693 length:609 start_codon:yes stop_codon:yes gene_type:complete